MLDKERHLVYDLNAYAELEDRFGSVEAAMGKLQEGSLKTLRTVLWVGLMHEQEDLTEKEVGKLVGMAELEYITKSISEAFDRSSPSTTGNK